MLQLPDHLLFLVLALVTPLRALVAMRRLQRVPVDDLPRLRMRIYVTILAFQWGLSALAVLWWRSAGRSWQGLGLVARLNGGTIGVALGVVIVLVILAFQQRRARLDEHAWDRLRERMRPLERLLPRTPRELRWFEIVSLTAGVCEELLYRGFLIWYLAHGMGLVPAALLAAVIFGVGHLYQGLSGIARTGALGAFLVAVYLLTGSLYLGMLLHFLADFYSGHVMYEAYRRAPAGPPSAPGAGEA